MVALVTPMDADGSVDYRAIEALIDQVLAVGNGESIKVGTPLVSGATVTATVVSHGRGDKVRIFKMRRRKHYQKRQGHRQNYTELQIGSING